MNWPDREEEKAVPITLLGVKHLAGKLEGPRGEAAPGDLLVLTPWGL